MTGQTKESKRGRGKDILFEEVGGQEERRKRSVFRYHNCKTMKRAFEHLSSLLYSAPHTPHGASARERTAGCRLKIAERHKEGRRIRSDFTAAPTVLNQVLR